MTLLRTGEANKAPLPPPPSSDQPPPNKPASLNGDDLALDASNEEIHAAIHEDPSEKGENIDNASTTGSDTTKKPKHHHGERILGLFKGTTRTGVETKLGLDKIRAKAGSAAAKNHLGVLPKRGEVDISGPVNFRGRHHGHKGWIHLSTSATSDIPTVSWSKDPVGSDGDAGENGGGGKEKAAFRIPIEEIQELKKVGGLGWKAKIVVGWATGRTVADGLEIVDRGGKTWKVTAVQYREELFNRLVAIGGQKWESW